MSRTLTISDSLFDRLQHAAQRRGKRSVEELLESLPVEEDETSRSIRAVQDIRALHARMAATYGVMPDSTDLIREDRLARPLTATNS